MALHHFGDDHLPDNSSVLRDILPDGKPATEHHHHRPPSWLNSANHFPDANFLNLQTSSSPATSNQWLSRSILQRNMSEVSGDSMPAAAEYNNNNSSRSDGEANWQHTAEILSHLLYEQLPSAHVACLRIATPVDQLPRIDAQLTQSQQVFDKYSAATHGADDKRLGWGSHHPLLFESRFRQFSSQSPPQRWAPVQAGELVLRQSAG